MLPKKENKSGSELKFHDFLYPKERDRKYPKVFFSPKMWCDTSGNILFMCILSVKMHSIRPVSLERSGRNFVVQETLGVSSDPILTRFYFKE